MRSVRLPTLTALGAAALLNIGAVSAPHQPVIKATSAPLLHQGGLTFKDLNRDGRLEPYEDWRLSPEARAADLTKRMTLAEKAGLLMHGTPPAVGGNFAGPWDMAALTALIQRKHILTFINRLSLPADEMARMSNDAQAAAENTRLGIPVIFSSDPRNQFQATGGLSTGASQFSLWPDAPGLAATNDPALVRRFGDIARQEYRAVGITMALSPQADLATEPDWSRINGTFGEDPQQVRAFVKAYVQGFQGGDKGLQPDGVIAVVKHWVGYGAEPGGFDAHNPYGKTLAFPGHQFDTHIIPFEGAFEAGAAGIMPTYAKPPAGLMIDGQPAEQVGAGFSHQMLHDLLRRKYGFKGIVVSDFLITSDCGQTCQNGTLNITQMGMPWGVESLSKADRFAKALNAGVDQFGGVMDADIIIDLVRTGKVSMVRIDDSARAILTQMFKLGLFENPYADPEVAARTVGSDAFRAAGMDAQRKSLVLLKNDGILPLGEGRGRKVWLYNISPEVAKANGFVPVDSPDKADLALLRIATPYENLHPNYFFGRFFHEGSLAYKDDNADLRAVEAAAAAHIPSVVSIYLDRAAILTPIAPLTKGLIANFGVSDAALFDVLTGRAPAQGRLPFELPSSEAAVAAQKPDTPHDSKDPLYPIGFGLKD